MRRLSLVLLCGWAASGAACRGGVRSGQGDAASSVAAEPAGVAVSATDPRIAYVGRVDRAAQGGPLLGFVGASVRVRFRGTGLELRLKDFGAGTPQTTNYYDVTVDGAAPSLLEASPSRVLYRLASGLPEGEHEVELFKRVEAGPGGRVGAGKGQILGFVLHGSELLPVQLPARRLEFVGDSITCGYGNEVSTMHPENAPYTTRHSNGHRAYGALTAALLGAQYSAVAYSGRGVSRNYAGGAGQLVPDMYTNSLPEEPGASAWDPAAYVPDAVIINLGTNDFSTPGVDRRAFVTNYERFLAQLRGYYPKAALVIALGPMLSDYYPPGAQAWTNARADVQAAVVARTQAGDSNVYVVLFEPQSPPVGEDWHPTVATHQKMAEKLVPELRRILAW
jgi:lysophospholipase L1-like esterase